MPAHCAASPRKPAAHARASGRRRAPQLEDILEPREVLSPFPFTGTYSGDYSVLVEGRGPTETVSGSISVSISVTSVLSVGDGLYQAYISGTVSFTGFVDQSATYPFAGSYGQEQNGGELGAPSTGIDPSVDIDLTAVDPSNPYNNVFIEGYCTNTAIVGYCDISMNGYATPNAAEVTLGGAPATPGSPSTPGPVELTGGNVVKAKKGGDDIVVDVIGSVGGGTGLPVSDFRLTTVSKRRSHAVAIPLASATYSAASDIITLVPRRKQKLKLPLELTVSSLAGGSYSLEIDTRGTDVAARLATAPLVDAVVGENAALAAWG